MEDLRPRFFSPHVASRRSSAKSPGALFYERLRLVDSPYADADSCGDPDDDWAVRKRPRGLEGYWNRQVFLHSYHFTREQSIRERVKSSLMEFKSFVWALMVSNCESVLAVKIKEKLKSTGKIKQKLKSTTQYLSCPHCFV